MGSVPASRLRDAASASGASGHGESVLRLKYESIVHRDNVVHHFAILKQLTLRAIWSGVKKHAQARIGQMDGALV